MGFNSAFKGLNMRFVKYYKNS